MAGKTYPENIKRRVRQNLDLESNDTSKDKHIDNMSPSEVFSRCLMWEGICGSYDSLIKMFIKDIYNVDLDRVERN